MRTPLSSTQLRKNDIDVTQLSVYTSRDITLRRLVSKSYETKVTGDHELGTSSSTQTDEIRIPGGTKGVILSVSNGGNQLNVSFEQGSDNTVPFIKSGINYEINGKTTTYGDQTYKVRLGDPAPLPLNYYVVSASLVAVMTASIYGLSEDSVKKDDDPSKGETGFETAGLVTSGLGLLFMTGYKDADQKVVDTKGCRLLIKKSTDRKYKKTSRTVGGRDFP